MRCLKQTLAPKAAEFMGRAWGGVGEHPAHVSGFLRGNHHVHLFQRFAGVWVTGQDCHAVAAILSQSGDPMANLLIA